MVRLFFILFVIAIGWNAGAEDCGTDQTGGVEYKYCVHKSGQKDADVILYLHGGGGNEKQWFAPGGFGDQFKKAYADLKRPMPSIISFSFGPSWLLGDVDTPRHPALLPIVTSKILPRLEAQVDRGHGRLFVLGASMGGYNSSLLALRLENKFAKALPLCPGMVPLPFAASESEVDTYLKENSPKIIRRSLEGVLNWVKHDFKTAEAWSRHDPLELANVLPVGKTGFFISSTYDDDYGFYAGAKTFADRLKARGYDVETSFDFEGRHCQEIDSNIPTMARFLAK